MKNLISVTLFTVILFSCSTKSENKSNFDLNAAKAEIANSNNNFESYVSKGDSVGLATNLYTIDAKLMAPNSESAVGRAKLTSALGEIIKSGITGIKLTTADIWGDENNITEEGTFDLNIKDGTVVDKGKYLVLWKKEDGKWKIHRDSFNSNMPITSAK